MSSKKSPSASGKSKPATKKTASTKTSAKKVPARSSAKKSTASQSNPSPAKKSARASAPTSPATKSSPQTEMSVNHTIRSTHESNLSDRVVAHLDVDEGMDPGFFPRDEVVDEAEIAQHIQLKEQAAISVRARELNRPETHPDFDGQTCVECGEDIPPARLLLRRVRCVDCQTFLEEEAARRRRTSM